MGIQGGLQLRLPALYFGADGLLEGEAFLRDAVEVDRINGGVSEVQMHAGRWFVAWVDEAVNAFKTIVS